MPLEVPSRDEMRRIAAEQDAREAKLKAVRKRRASAARWGGAGTPPTEEEAAAQVIQRNYRGYRERRQMQGLGLDASTRWLEVCLRTRSFLPAKRPKSIFECAL
ncbi:hypothetical protein BDY21DRAFT_336334 [Lineolata rhizophorae]|uniref:Uncharacterized protein n=1 Tax=Lineolata rhizophorae TaxID=578093 RepID=A0A6A6P6W7_9PEZI|nr:hypothetical protein BDY21DRAFT_336334 [Lineolata rhizophorae]